MVRVCAWCERYLGLKDSPGGDAVVTHGICPTCVYSRQWAADPPVVVVSRSREALVTVLRALLRPADVRVVVDRRLGERRRLPEAPGADIPPERRRGPDRRRGITVAIV